ncbi:MAG: hypothetical protein IKA63_06310 [Clostridia bacterium]|nr:hypothetical protein [Clostridia bacterium]
MKLTVIELVLFALLGALMLAGDVLMDWLPNVHLVGVLLATYTAVYRWKALIPLYVYISLLGLISGFPMWWWAYLYGWLPLWGACMLLPRTLTPKTAIAYGIACAVHGFSFGALCALSQVPLLGLPWSGLPAYIAAGLFPFDMIHGVGNAALSVLILPLATVLKRAPRHSI